jgi:hypothetical protein
VVTATHIVIVRRITSTDPAVGCDTALDGTHHPTADAAITAGFTACRCDDFNVGRVQDGRLVWFGWMDHEIPTDRYRVAHQIGLTA